MNQKPSPSSDPGSNYRRRALITTAIVLAAIALFYFIWQAIYVLMLVFAGVLLAIFLRALADGLSHVTRLSTRWSLVITVVVVVGLLGLFVWFAAGKLVGQINELVTQLPAAVQPIRDKLNATPLGKMVLQAVSQGQPFNAQGATALSRATGFVSSALGALFAAVVIFFLGFYFAWEPTLYTNGLLRLMPKQYRPRGAEVLGAVGYTLRWWLLAQFIDMWIIGAATALGLWLLGVKLALVLGLLAALFNFVPNFGPLVSMVPATLLALPDGTNKAIAVVVLFMVLQSIEGYLLLPLLQRKAVDLPPVLTIAAQVLMGILLGPIGLVLATPLLAATLVLVQMLYVDETLGDDIHTPEDDIQQKDIPPVPGRKPAKR